MVSMKRTRSKLKSTADVTELLPTLPLSPSHPPLDAKAPHAVNIDATSSKRNRVAILAADAQSALIAHTRRARCLRPASSHTR